MQELIPNRIYRAEIVTEDSNKGKLYMFKYEHSECTDIGKYVYHVGPYVHRELNILYDRGDFIDSCFIFELMPETFELKDFLCKN